MTQEQYLKENRAEIGFLWLVIKEKQYRGEPVEWGNPEVDRYYELMANMPYSGTPVTMEYLINLSENHIPQPD